MLKRCCFSNKEKIRKEKQIIQKADLEKAEREREREEEKKKRESEGMSECHWPHRPKFTLCMHPLQLSCAAIWEGKQVDLDEQFIQMENIEKWMGNDVDDDNMDF
jgi:hypothetical protein